MNKPDADIAVIVTAHNYGRFLKACLDSILSQTLRPSQVLVVDDNSDDGTESVVRDYPDVSYHQVRFENGNQARNYGFSKTTSEWVVFFDADNHMAPDFLKELHEAVSDDVSFVYCDRVNFSEGDVSWYQEPMGVWSSRDFNADDLKRGNYVDLASLIRARCFPGFDESLKRCQDWDLWLNLVLNVNCTGRYVNQALFHYRIHGESVTRREDRDRAVWYIKRKYGLGLFARIPLLKDLYFLFKILKTIRNWFPSAHGAKAL
jgi:glycosyltransferase involved in cell wall biosynthesis